MTFAGSVYNKTLSNTALGKSFIRLEIIIPKHKERLYNRMKHKSSSQHGKIEY